MLAGVGMMTGCRHQNDAGTAEIKYVNAVPDADAVSITAKRHTIFGSRIYGSATDYVKAPAGSYLVSTSAELDGQPDHDLPGIACTLVKDQKYFGISLGCVSNAPRARTVVFDAGPTDDLTGEQARVRVIDAFPAKGKLDVILNNIVAFPGLVFGRPPKAIVLPAQSYVGKTIASGDYLDPIISSTTLKIGGGKAYELIILGPSPGTRPSMFLIED